MLNTTNLEYVVFKNTNMRNQNTTWKNQNTLIFGLNNGHYERGRYSKSCCTRLLGKTMLKHILKGLYIKKGEVRNIFFAIPDF